VPTKRTAEDWTPEAIRRFWEWQAPRPELQKQYFSLQVGRALAGVFELAGGRRGEVLDFGCGPGYLLQQLCAGGDVRVHGVDFSPRSVEEAARRMQGVPEFAGAQAIEALPTKFPDAQFDGLTCIETVEHLRDDQLHGLLAEVRRLLKPGGIAMFSTPCNEDLERAQAYCPFCDSEFHNMQHLRYFSPPSLRTLLEGAGLEVLFCDGLDLWRYQPRKGRRFIDLSLRDVLGDLLGAARRVCASVVDALFRPEFSRKLAFRARLRPGPHLIAVARMPAPGS